MSFKLMKTKYLDLPTLIFYLFVQLLRQERTKGGFTGLAKRVPDDAKTFKFIPRFYWSVRSNR